MPHINRIRVNNVKYNFGTQYYDDFFNKNDIEAFKVHYKRWSNYLPPIPNAKVFEVTFYKTMYNERAVYPKLRKQAKQWLIDNGYNPNIN